MLEALAHRFRHAHADARVRLSLAEFARPAVTPGVRSSLHIQPASCISASPGVSAVADAPPTLGPTEPHRHHTARALAGKSTPMTVRHILSPPGQPGRRKVHDDSRRERNAACPRIAVSQNRLTRGGCSAVARMACMHAQARSDLARCGRPPHEQLHTCRCAALRSHSAVTATPKRMPCHTPRQHRAAEALGARAQCEGRGAAAPRPLVQMPVVMRPALTSCSRRRHAWGQHACCEPSPATQTPEHEIHGTRPKT